MSKARTLADFISDGSEFADGTISVAEVSGAAPLASPTFTGTVTSTGNIALGDDDELVLGSNRMRLYYSASNNYTVLDSNGTSGFVFDGVNNLSVNIGGSLSGAFTANGVSLYSGGTEKLQVYGSGTIALDDIKVNDDVKIGFGQFHTDLELYHDSATTTNKLVGDLTQTGKLSTDALDLSAISDTISDTAVDIFVYDTRKDSDGGAWRKRTQGTSWYNEAASATRGSRKEFPSVAVIVVNSDTGSNLPHITIYDGDDPDLPMWMEFTRVSQDPYLSSYTNGATMVGNYPVGAAFAKNGVLALSSTRSAGALSGLNAGLRVINFVSDSAIAHSNTDAYVFPNNISQRDTLVDAAATSGAIVNVNANDVAMTVLPNAPIDAATGLPVPTIAVATAGGTSIIRDDGTVVDYTLGNYAIPTVDFDYDNNIVQSSRNIGSGGGGLYVNKYPILSADNNSGTIQQELVISSSAGDNTSGLDFIRTPFVEGTKNVVGMKNSTLAFSSDAGAVQGIGVYQLGPDGTTKTTTLGAVISSDYNTGWMNGQIKLATLSDTDDTNVTGSELVTNGDFSSATGWSVPTGVSISSGVATYSSPSHGANLQQTATSFVSGKTYTISVEVTAFTSGGITIYANYSSGTSTTVAVSKLRSVGLHSFTWTAASDGTGFSLQADSVSNGACILTVDNVSVRLAEEDRSVNGNGLQVFGTVTKSAVATGADLVAYSYSSSSTSNYLMQPYNSDLAFGTGDFSVMFWTKAADFTPSGSGVNFVIGLDTDLGAVTNKGAISIASSTANDLRFQIYQQGYASGGRIDCIDTDAIPTNTWNCICAVRRSGVFEIWLNGQLKATNADNLTADVSNLNTDGWHILSSNQQDVNMSLLRASATAPSPEQIKKIYEDEKVLFQDGAQATLYGSSDAVTALAYDDSTELLHVGTSAGRSVFQGLRRVENTTTAVGAAISASNGLVADE